MSISRSQPATIERALQAMRSRYGEMSESQRLLADFILEKPYQIAFASAANVGGQLGISSATVVRFAAFLGLSGYADLQKLARQALTRQVSEVTQFKSRSSVLTGGSVLHRNLRADIESIERTGELITEGAFERAVRLLAKARTIHVGGFRSNYGLAHQFVFNLNLIGRRAVALRPGVGDLPEQLLHIRAGDACVVITFKRYTAQIRPLIEHARTSGVPVLAITNPDPSFVGESADVVLPVSVKYPSVLESRVAAQSVLNSLMTGVALLQPKTTAESLRRHEALWASLGTYLGESARPGAVSPVAAFDALNGRRGAREGGRKRASRRPAVNETAAD
jgi:DNA-binding MurR/RpiR family transcriptional regulator